MKYTAKAITIHNENGKILINDLVFPFGITNKPEVKDPSPVEFLISSLNACILKSIERLSGFMDFNYSKAEISIIANRTDKPTRITSFDYELKVYSSDPINTKLLQKNIENHGTIFNTLKASCAIKGNIEIVII